MDVIFKKMVSLKKHRLLWSVIDDRIKSNVREVELPSELFPLVVVEKGRKVMAHHLEPKVGQFFSHQPHKLYCSHYTFIGQVYKHKQKLTGQKGYIFSKSERYLNGKFKIWTRFISSFNIFRIKFKKISEHFTIIKL